MPSYLSGVDFIKVISEVVRELDAEGVRYALIGGFAMALRGVQRATMDLDFLLMLEDLETADRILRAHEYDRRFKSENVSHYQSIHPALGRIDILHAFRGPTLSMLQRVDRLEVASDLSLPVVQVEDLIGLKVQASVNDPSRRERDWSDIRMLLQAKGESRSEVDWPLLSDYLRLFDLESELETFKRWYGSID